MVTATQLGMSAEQLRLLRGQSSKDDPPLLFEWKADNLASFIAKINNYNGQLRAPFNVSAQLTPADLQEALMALWAAGIPGLLPRIGALAMPASQVQFALLIAQYRITSIDPWFADVDNDNTATAFPLVRVYTLRLRSSVGQLDSISQQFGAFQ